MTSRRLMVGVALNRATARRAVREFIDAEPGLEIASVTPTVTTALARATDGLDVMVTDSKTAIEAGHVEIVRAIGADANTRLIVLADDITMAQLDLGIDENVFVSAVSDEEMVEALRATLVAKPAPTRRPARPRPSKPKDGRPAPSRRPSLVVIGSSTGGPEALTAVLTPLPVSFPAPILVVQHMPASFTGLLANTLDRACPLSVREVSEPTVAMPGEVWIAPGDKHLLVGDATGKIILGSGAPENSCRPSVDVLFRSAAPHFGNRVVAVMLTGMGNDGQEGTRALAELGAHVIAQDKASSVVWGMPGAVVAAGLADEVLPLGRIADQLRARFHVRPPVGAPK